MQNTNNTALMLAASATQLTGCKLLPRRCAVCADWDRDQTHLYYVWHFFSKRWARAEHHIHPWFRGGQANKQRRRPRTVQKNNM
eukprot:6206467-Pleurochrysis_carterae.AAC.2